MNWIWFGPLNCLMIRWNHFDNFCFKPTFKKLTFDNIMAYIKIFWMIQRSLDLNMYWSFKTHSNELKLFEGPNFKSGNATWDLGNFFSLIFTHLPLCLGICFTLLNLPHVSHLHSKKSLSSHWFNFIPKSTFSCHSQKFLCKLLQVQVRVAIVGKESH
jgi:hypothetical protein